RAVVLTLPVVFVFGKLLAAADPVFATVFAVPDLNFGDVASHLIVVVISAWLCAGWMCGALLSGASRTASGERLPFALGVTEISAVLGALNAPFALFVGRRRTWLFGGA